MAKKKKKPKKSRAIVWSSLVLFAILALSLGWFVYTNQIKVAPFLNRQPKQAVSTTHKIAMPAPVPKPDQDKPALSGQPGKTQTPPEPSASEAAPPVAAAPDNTEQPPAADAPPADIADEQAGAAVDPQASPVSAETPEPSAPATDEQTQQPMPPAQPAAAEAGTLSAQKADPANPAGQPAAEKQMQPPPIPPKAAPAEAEPEPEPAAAKAPEPAEMNQKPAPPKKDPAQEQAVAAAEGTTAPVAMDAGPKRFTIQVGAYLTREYAEDKLSDLLGRGYDAYLYETADKQKRNWYIVRLAHFRERSEAEDFLRTFIRKEKMKAVIALAHKF